MLEGMKKNNLNIFDSDSGSVMHGLKNSDEGFNKFGEVYFSSIKENSIRAWKLHKKMTLNLIVPIGRVLFCFFDDRDSSFTKNEFYKILLSRDPYVRLTVPPGIWFGFKGIGKYDNIICNVSDIIHDPNEIIRKDLNKINIDWSNE